MDFSLKAISAQIRLKSVPNPKLSAVSLHAVNAESNPTENPKEQRKNK
jgi:hypothetical protein